MPATMQSYTLIRTGQPPLAFTGSLVGRLTSPNADLPEEMRHGRQWFTVDIYTTKGGAWIAHVQYRAGHKLRFEQPVDLCHTAKSSRELLEVLDGIDPLIEFVAGVPNEGRPTPERDRDLTRFHSDVRGYGQVQWDAMMDRITDLLEAPETIE